MNLEQAKQLSPEEINKTIAEALGWRLMKEKCPPDPFGDFPNGFTLDVWVSPDGEESKYPDYFHDLNECFEAAKTISGFEESVDDLSEYGKYLILIGYDESIRTAVDAPSNIRAIALAVVLSERKK